MTEAERSALHQGGTHGWAEHKYGLVGVTSVTFELHKGGGGLGAGPYMSIRIIYRGNAGHNQRTRRDVTHDGVLIREIIAYKKAERK